MILQALKGYYDRKAADPTSGIAPRGFEWKEFFFVILLDKTGSFIKIEDWRGNEGKKKTGHRFLVPQGEKKASGIKANLLWDTANYVFGVVSTEGLTEKERQNTRSRLPKQQKAFIERIENELPDTPKKAAVLRFFSTSTTILEKDSNWAEVYQTNPNITFRFDGEQQIYCESDEIKKVVEAKVAAKVADGRCLITGEQDTISTLHTAIKGVWGAQSSGANIVSFNLDSFRSFGKKQGQNAPVGEAAMFAYTTALNHLLDKKSSQRMQVGDASTVFWSERQSNFENIFGQFFTGLPKDNPDDETNDIIELLESPKSGAYTEYEKDTQFFVLGLSPNAARISIRFWQVGTIQRFRDNIRQHFMDLKIDKPEREPKYYTLKQLLLSTAVQNKEENIPPNLEGDFMRSILDSTPYPATLLQAVLRRIRSDTAKRVTPVRASLLKAYFNRYERYYNYSNRKELNVGLNRDNQPRAYHLGSLFAVLEKIQEEANPRLNATIRERYYGAACGTPVVVFPTLLRLKNHHLAKLGHKGRKVFFEKLIAEIMSYYDDFPSQHDLHEQGKFAIGYYHQRQEFFITTKDEPAQQSTQSEQSLLF
jgi:CRISPR-associated protein Csd1